MDTTTRIQIEPTDRFHARSDGDRCVTVAGPQDIVSDLSLHFGLSDRDALSSLVDAALEALRDLDILLVNEQEKRSLSSSNFLDSDDTSAMARRFKEQKAEREARRSA